LPPDEAEKRRNALCLASFDNEVWRQKDQEDVQVIDAQFLKEAP